MQSQPPNTQGPSPHQPSPGLGVQAAGRSIPFHPPSNPHAPLSLPGPQIPQALIPPTSASGASTPGLGAPAFPMPQRNWTVPPPTGSPPTGHTLRPAHSDTALSSHSSNSSRVNLPVPVITKEKPPPVPAALEELHEALNYQEGEMPVLEKDDRSWSTMIRVEPLATQKPKKLPWWNCLGDEFSWVDGSGVLLENYLLLLGKETTPDGKIKSSHVIRPIPLECLRLASFNDEEEGRKHEQGFLKGISCWHKAPLPDPMYPFTIYHSAAKITRRHTLYTRSATERNRWHTALESAIAERKSRQDGKMLYTTQILNDRFFRIAPRIQFTRGVHYTGRTVCAAGFTVQGEGYIAVGCTTGVYVSKRATEYSFRRVLEFNEPTSIAAIPAFGKFLVHCEKALYSYPLDMIVRAFRGEATFNDLDIEMKRLAKEHGTVSFLKTGSITGRTFVIYAANNENQTSSHILELTREGVNPGDPAEYKLLSSVPIPEDPHDAVFFRDKVAICASKAVYIVEPLKTDKLSYTEVPDLPYSKRPKKFWQRKDKGERPKILDLIDKANILGLVTYQNDILLVYEDFGCFVGQELGKPARTSYYIQWERRASAYTRREAHLLLLSPGYIEVRKIDSGRLVQIMETNEMRLLRSSLTDPVPIAAMIGGTEEDGGRTEKIVELISNGY